MINFTTPARHQLLSPEDFHQNTIFECLCLDCIFLYLKSKSDEVPEGTPLSFSVRLNQHNCGNDNIMHYHAEEFYHLKWWLRVFELLLLIVHKHTHWQDEILIEIFNFTLVKLIIILSWDQPNMHRHLIYFHCIHC